MIAMAASDGKAPGISGPPCRAAAGRGRPTAAGGMRRWAIGVAAALATCGVLAAAEAYQGQPRLHGGICDASAGVASGSDPGLFFVANDEDQGDVILRLYNL